MMRVSVVVPTFRRPDQLDRCLKALLSQNLDPAQYEILIADDAADLAAERQVEWQAKQTGVAIRRDRSPWTSCGPKRWVAGGQRSDHRLH